MKFYTNNIQEMLFTQVLISSSINLLKEFDHNKLRTSKHDFLKSLVIAIFFLSFSLCLNAQHNSRPMIAAYHGLKVNSATGNLFYKRTDFSVKGIGLPINATFYYNSSRDTFDIGYGRGWTFKYGMSYQIISDTILIKRGSGRRDSFAIINGIPQSPQGNFDQLEEYQSGKFILTNKQGKRYFFDDPSHQQLTKIEDRHGNNLIFSYTNSQLTQIENNAGRSITLQWNNDHLNKIIYDNREVNYAYEDTQLSGVTDPSNLTEWYEHGGLNFSITRIIDRKANPIIINYDGLGRVESIVSCEGIQNFTFIWDARLHTINHRITIFEQKNQSGTITSRYNFDEKLLIKNKKTSHQQEYDYVYDDDFNLIRKRKPKGTNQYGYDNNGNKIYVKNANDQTKIYTYNDLNQLTSFTKNNQTTQLQYDANNNLESVSFPENVQKFFNFNDDGQLIGYTDGNNHSYQLTYHPSNGNLEEIQLPVGNYQFLYDDIGNPIKVIDPLNQPADITYNQLDYPTNITFNDTISYDLTFDPNGNLESKTDPEQSTRQFYYDGLDRLARVESETGATQYEYDPTGNLIKVINPNNHEKQFSYNGKNRISKQTDAIGNQTAYTYDEHGRLVAKVDPSGRTTEYAYDIMNRLKEKKYQENTDHYEYNSAGRLKRCYNDHVDYSFEYDALSRIITARNNTWDQTIEYTYDANGNRTSMIVPNVGTTSYTYGSINELTSVTNPFNETTSFTYDVGGRILSQSNFNGTSTQYEYVGRNWIQQMDHQNTNSTFLSQNYNYNKSGYCTSTTDQNGQSHAYQYDKDYQLTAVTYPNGTTENFQIDPAGNRTAINKNGINTSYDYNEADELLSAGNQTFAYDQAGNLISKSMDNVQANYFYDGNDRLIKIEISNGITRSYKYDPLGRKINEIDENGTEKRFIYDLNNLLMETDNQNQLLSYYTSGRKLDHWISFHSNNQSYVFHQNIIKSTLALTDSDQNVVTNFEYDAYGNLLNQSGTISTPLLFQGRYFDFDTKMYDYRSRHYHPEIGRFNRRDDFSGFYFYPQSLHKYIFVQNNPINYIDPNGTSVTDAATAINKYVNLRGLGNFVETADEVINKDLPDYQNREVTRYTTEEEELKMTRNFIIRSKKKLVAAGVAVVAGPYYTKLTKDKYKNVQSPEFPNDKDADEYEEEEYEEEDEEENEDEEEEDDEENESEDEVDEENNSGVGSDDDPSHEIVCEEEEEEIVIDLVEPFDPNDIIGPEGYDTIQWIARKDRINYRIRYENDAEAATAAAQRVEVRLPIDETVNPYALQLGSFGFANMIFEIPPNSSFYSNRLDVIDSVGVLVDIVAGIDTDNREIYWILQSIDPNTGLPPTDALAGFLPVNDNLTNRGQGFVILSLKPSNNTITGDSIKEQAAIYFDINEPVLTNIWHNLIDAFPPTSTIDSDIIPLDSNTVQLQFSGLDDFGGVGLSHYDLFVTENGINYNLYGGNIDTTVYNFVGNVGTTYSFYTLATDHVGNQEMPKDSADLTITIGDAPLPMVTLLTPISGNTFCMNEIIEITWNGNLDFIDLLISYDGGNNFIVIEENVNATLGSYLWQIPNNSFGLNAIIQIRYSSNNTILSQSATIPLYELPIVALGNDTTLINGQSLLLDAGNSGATYVWSTGTETQTINVDLPGTYIVTVTNENGCSSQDEIVVSFITSTNQLAALQSFIVTPNPTNGPVTIIYELAQSQKVQLDIFDTKGQLVQSNNYEQQNTGKYQQNLTLHKFAKGIYLFRLMVGTQQYSQKVSLL